MKIEVLYFTGCPNHEPTAMRVRQVARRLDIDVPIDQIEVTDHDNPAAMKFVGSPTVLVNGQDIDPTQREGGSYGFGCRTFAGEGVPSEAMIESALREAAA